EGGLGVAVGDRVPTAVAGIEGDANRSGSVGEDADTTRSADIELIEGRRGEVGRGAVCPDERALVVGFGTKTGSKTDFPCRGVVDTARDRGTYAAGDVGSAADDG